MLHISTVNRKAKLVGVTREVMSPKLAESLPVAGLCWLFTRPLVARDALGELTKYKLLDLNFSQCNFQKAITL